ncbi:phage holin family protein [Clostridium botulinum]|uniref:phage holin family protein n=1 Tax=Clostridium botulinum TaxID=1491 RepID=UPI001966D51C|nr:phage holin family protein [Clostridium botulinum]MBN1048692.1 holin [Clostridium botulinum]
MEFINYITESALILVPVIFIIGTVFKGTEKIEDKYIPIILLPIGIILSMLLIGFNIEGFIQGILVTGAAVYTNQLIKQSNKEE